LTNSFHFIGTQPENFYVTARAVILCKFCNKIYLCPLVTLPIKSEELESHVTI
jgi:hypothetical protein